MCDAPPEVWDDYFSKNHPPATLVRRLVSKLNETRKHEHVIALLEAALIHGQSQPWMYEVLAVTMEIVGRPKPDIERVLLSQLDFTATDISSMLYSAAYLTRFDRSERALSLYRQASNLDPLRLEPYVLGLKLARQAKDVDAIEWGAAGILSRGWTKDYEALQKQAEQAVAEAEVILRKEGDSSRQERFTHVITEARQRDLVLRLTWSGDADLDLIVEEPLGTICSFETPYTRGGGILVHDGSGPNQKNTHETYVCPIGIAGEYRVIVRHVGGNIVAKQATLTITRYQGTPQEVARTHTVPISNRDYVLKVSLHQGRRKELAAYQPPPPVYAEAVRPRRNDLNSRLGQEDRDTRIARANLAAARLRESALTQLRQVAAGFQPVVGVVPEGAALTASAVISADRRYVRISAFPSFSTITEIFTFSFNSVGGNGAAQTGGGQGNPGGQPANR